MFDIGPRFAMFFW
jgi:hypothetical protein